MLRLTFVDNKLPQGAKFGWGGIIARRARWQRLAI